MGSGQGVIGISHASRKRRHFAAAEVVAPSGLRGYFLSIMKAADGLGGALRIESIQMDGAAWLAPLSGATDAGFRRIARRFGAGAVVSEMVASDELVAGSEEARLRAEGTGIHPHVVQLAGCSPAWMAEAARLVAGSGADVVDINMGCPAKRVVGGFAGSALMRDLDTAERL